ncbi:MAG: DUF4880 domain-containing protein [Thermomicrobiales bacterium]
MIRVDQDHASRQTGQRFRRWCKPDPSHLQRYHL